MYHPQLYAPAPPPSTFIEHYSALSCVLTDYGRRQNVNTIPVVPIQTLRFDDQQELIWSGNVSGHVTSYYSDQLSKYTSFSLGLDDPCLQLLTGDFGLLGLLKDELKLRDRRGIPKFSYSSSTFRDMLCMSKLPSQLIMLGGLAQNLIEFDLERKRQIRTTELDSKEVGCCLIRQHPKFICCADLEGRVTLRNTNNLAVTHTFKTHTGQIADFDVHGNYLVTCGYPSSRPTTDRFLMVYDLRTYRSVAPMQTVFSPSLIRFIPAFTSKFCIASSLGRFQLLDVAGSAAENCTAFTHQVQMQPDASLTAMTVSSSGQALAFGDDLGLLHLFGTNTNVAFNQFSAPTEFPDPLEAVPPIDVDDLLIPLSAVPTYPYNVMYEKPVSNRDGLIEKDNVAAHKTPKIDEKIIETLTYRQDVGYAPNPYKSKGPISYIKGNVGVVGLTKIEENTQVEKSDAELIEFAINIPKTDDKAANKPDGQTISQPMYLPAAIWVTFVSFLKFFIPKSWYAKDVSNDIVLITGGGSGLGRQIALEFAKLNASLVLWDINLDGLKETQKLVQDEYAKLAQKRAGKTGMVEEINRFCKTYIVDVSNREEVYKKAKKVHDDINGETQSAEASEKYVSVLVNNAGIYHGMYLQDLKDEQIERVFKINILAHFWTVRAFLPKMIEHQRGHIVEIASMGGLSGLMKQVDYCATKFATVGFEESLSIELDHLGLGDKIHTTAVCPLFFQSNLFTGFNSNAASLMKSNHVARDAVMAMRCNQTRILVPMSAYFLTFFRPFSSRKSLLLLTKALGFDEGIKDIKGAAATR